MLNKQGKVWGDTQHIFGKNNVSIHRIEVQPGGYCSKHKHDHKWNAFYVEAGILKVKVWKNDYNLVDEILLKKGEGIHIKPGEYHQFVCPKLDSYTERDKTVVYEIYWTELNESDIVRKTVGGLIQ